MKCKHCNNKVINPIVKSVMINNTPTSVRICPVSKENLDSSKTMLIVVVILLVGVLSLSKLFG